MPINIGEIRLRRPESKDVEAMYQYRNDPEIVATLVEFSKGYTKNDLLDWVERQRKNMADLIWVIADAADNCIGHCGLYQINSITGVAELAICMGSSAHRGSRTGLEIMKAVVNYAFGQMNLRKLRNDIPGTDEKSMNALKTLGFREECVLREQEYRNGQFVDVHVFGLFRRDWNPDRLNDS
jgi:RimJ/RimL family protein N-acetyltransferase